MNPDGNSLWWEPEETLGPDDMRKVHSHVHEAWNTMKMDPLLLRQGNMSMEEGVLVCHSLELAVSKGNYPNRSVAGVTTHYVQMVWLQWCLRYVGSKWRATQVPILLTVATQDGFQGQQAPVIFGSLVSATPRIMHDIRRSNTLTSRAQPELHLLGGFTGWDGHPTPGAWIAALHDVSWEARSATVSTTLELARVLREGGVVEKVMEGTIYRLAPGGGVVALAMEGVEEEQEGT